MHFYLQGCHLLWQAFPDLSISTLICNSPALNRADPTTPIIITNYRFGLYPVSLATTQGIDFLSLPRGT